LLHQVLDAAFRRQARRSMRLAPASGMPEPPPQPVFLYLHVPFCEVLCPFCTFHRVRYESGKARTYFAALRREIRLFHERVFRFSGVYVGGGTPTVEPGELVETLGLLAGFGPLGEVSVETNPGDLVPRVLDRLVTAGVRRLSVGVQSFDDGLLREMGRYGKYGSGADILARLAAAAGRFETLNVDMIFNLPHQTAAMLERDLDTVLAGPANQVSLYPLMSAPTAERSMRRTIGLPDRHRLSEFYGRILARLRPAFTPVSAWCFNRGGHGIDEYVVASPDYLGLGSGAFGYLDGCVYASTFSLHSYVDRIGQGLTGITGERQLSGRERMRYDLLMRLFGLKLERRWVRERYAMRFERTLWLELKALRALGAVRESADGWQLTDRGMLVWVLMMSAFFESVNEFRAQMRLSIRDESDAGEVAVVPPGEIGHGRPAHAGRWPAGLGR